MIFEISENGFEYRFQKKGGDECVYLLFVRIKRVKLHGAGGEPPSLKISNWSLEKGWIYPSQMGYQPTHNLLNSKRR